MGDDYSNIGGNGDSGSNLEGVVRKIYAQNPAFVLKNDSLFYETSFRVLLGEGGGALLPCWVIRENGCRCLIYPVHGCSLLSARMGLMTSDEAITFLASFTRALVQISQNGFLNMHMLLTDPSDIYVDDGSCHARLMYLPLRNRAAAQLSSERTLQLMRRRLAKYMLAPFAGVSAELETACSLLTSDSVSLEQLSWRLAAMVDSRNAVGSAAFGQGGRIVTVDERALNQQGGESKGLILKPLDAEGIREIVVDKAEYLIGRSAKTNDAVIPDPAVSRRHCKVVEDETGYSIVDLGSSYGTFVNGTCLATDVPTPLSEGDEVFIAGVVFRVEKAVRG